MFTEFPEIHTNIWDEILAIPVILGFTSKRCFQIYGFKLSEVSGILSIENSFSD